VSAAKDKSDKWLIRKKELAKAKKPLADLLCQSVRPEDFRYLKLVLQQIEQHVTALTAGYYQRTLSLD